ncbi:MAG TPA: RNA-binding protein [Micrococcales bacterium]|uniref:RNA-binding S4 domain-containing protein n=1 Tax=Miniimonas arenae TaxID=676201 RepID=A0A5C5BDR7_9MICO|nr:MULTISPECIES: RNA-binding S4 domain-containing protein [Miniimonas]TNU74854.1 RNA-binding S4 domain-containing protein [Miniimonas arenae]HCX85991.1 RNA-binding protein [Micrococcales bacterium]
MERASARVDSWLWAVRMYKTRSAAGAACRGGHVEVDGERAKPATTVGIGSRVTARVGDRVRELEVTGVLVKRVGAPEAQRCYIDHSPPPPPRELVAPVVIRDRGAGRPTKRERREIDRLRGRS